MIELPDGVQTCLRYEVERGGYNPQIRIANRDFQIPEAHNLSRAVRRLLSRFETPHKHLQRTSDAAKRLGGLDTLYRVKAAVAADRGDDLEAAAGGIAPWIPGLCSQCGSTQYGYTICVHLSK